MELQHLNLKKKQMWKTLRDRIIFLRGEICAHKTNITTFY